MPFLGAHPALLPALVEKGFAEPTEVQRAILEHPQPEADLLVSAQTGSGKTVAFGLAMAQSILREGRAEPVAIADEGADGKRPKIRPCLPLGLVVAPTRELAQQVAEELKWLFAAARMRVITCVGGMSIRGEQKDLRRGADIVVGTPGRLCDHLRQEYLSLAATRIIVLDEADEMLDMGFRDDLELILGAAPPTRRTLMFSATIPPGIANLAKKYQRDAQRIAVHRTDAAHADIDHQAVAVAPQDRVQAIVNLLRFHRDTIALIFCQTRIGVTELTHELIARGFHAVSLSGELSQKERMLALSALRDGKASICVATDVAARGIDLQGLGLVIHADLPQNMEVLTHRSGRTGRGGNKGVSVMLVPESRRGFATRVLSSRTRPLRWCELPTPAAIAAQDQAAWEAQLPLQLVAVSDGARAQAERLLNEYEPALLVAAWIDSARKQLPEVRELRGPRDPRSARSMRGDSRGDVRGDSRGEMRRDLRGDSRGDAWVDHRRGDERAEPRAGVRGGPAGNVRATSRGEDLRPGARAESRSRPALESRPSSDRPARANAYPSRGEERAARTDDRPARPGARAQRWEPPGAGGSFGAERPSRRAPRDEVWFSINVGRTQNANPKWIIPLLCRRGNITSEVIGDIVVQDRETRFAITTNAAASFAALATQPDTQDKKTRIVPSAPPM